MSLILGLDIATVTGFAWYEPGSSLSSIKTGLIKAAGDNAEEKAASLALQLRDLFYHTVQVDGRMERRLCKPDFVAIEQPMRNVVSFKKTKQTLAGPIDEQTINPNALQLEGLVCAAVAIIAAYRIPWETIPSATWRSFYFGRGFKPPLKKVGKEMKKDWKGSAIERCRVLKIDVKNADAAEAVGIAMAGEACQRFKMARAA
jgi:hypothetical protein